MINNVTKNHRTNGMTPDSANLVESTNIKSNVYQACSIANCVNNTQNRNPTESVALSDRVASTVSMNNTLEGSLLKVTSNDKCEHNIIKQQFKKSTDLNGININGMSVVFHAKFCNAVDLYKILLYLSGQDIHSKNPHDMTILHYAVMEKQTNMVRILLEAGADTSIKNRCSHTPLAYCKDKNTTIYNFLLQYDKTEVLNKKYPDSGIEIISYADLIGKYSGHRNEERIQYVGDNKELILQDISNILLKFSVIVKNDTLKLGDIRDTIHGKYLFGMEISVYTKINEGEAVTVRHKRGQSVIHSGKRACPHTNAFYLLGKDDEETYKKLICGSIIIHSALTGIAGLGDQSTNAYIDTVDIIENILVIYDSSKKRYISVKLDAIYDFNTGIFNIQKLQNILYDLSNSDTDLSKDLFERLLPCDFVPLDESSATKKLDAIVFQKGGILLQSEAEVGCEGFLEPPRDREEYNRYLTRLKEVNQLVGEGKNFNLKDLVGGGILDDIPRLNLDT